MSTFRSISSLTTQRYLDRATTNLARSSEKLSSGLRISSASDDAAGLAISSSLKKDSKLYAAATRNINDGLSALNIMQGALESQNEIIMRLQELATQSANGSLSYSQRYNLNDEYQALLKEFGRIGDTTKFNGTELLRGGRLSNASSFGIQAGIAGDVNSQLSVALTDSGSISGIIQAENGVLYSDVGAGVAYSTDELSQFGAALLRIQTTDSNGQTVNAIAALQPDTAAGTMSFVILVRADNTNGTFSSDPERWIGEGGATSITFDTSTGRVTGTGVSTISISNLEGGATATTSINLSGLTIRGGTSAYNYNNISLTGVETQSQAREALGVLSQRLSDSSIEIGKIGAMQSRLAIASNMTQALRNNSIAANSRIEDVDVAEESANYISAQIKQNAAASILAQANAQPEYLLSLLQ